MMIRVPTLRRWSAKKTKRNSVRLAGGARPAYFINELRLATAVQPGEAAAVRMYTQEMFFGISDPLIPNGDEKSRNELKEFIAREIDISKSFEWKVTVAHPLKGVTVTVELIQDAAEAEVQYLLDVFLRDDLVTQTAAATSAGVSIHVISQAIKDGRLRWFANPKAPNPRRGGRVVSIAEVREIWP